MGFITEQTALQRGSLTLSHWEVRIKWDGESTDKNPHFIDEETDLVLKVMHIYMYIYMNPILWKRKLKLRDNQVTYIFTYMNIMNIGLIRSTVLTEPVYISSETSVSSLVKWGWGAEAGDHLETVAFGIWIQAFVVLKLFKLCGEDFKAFNWLSSSILIL